MRKKKQYSCIASDERATTLSSAASRYLPRMSHSLQRSAAANARLINSRRRGFLSAVPCCRVALVARSMHVAARSCDAVGKEAPFPVSGNVFLTHGLHRRTQLCWVPKLIASHDVFSLFLSVLQGAVEAVAKRSVLA